MHQPTRYTADRVWTGSGRTIRSGYVDVTDGLITAVGRVADAPPPPAAVRALGDVTLLPGLIDAHVHVTFSASTDVVGDFEAEQRVEGGGPLLARGRASLATALAAGITTVRDLGTPAPIAVALRQELAEGRTVGAAFVTSASPLTTPGGHCHFLSHEVGPDDDPTAAVDRAVEAGADLIKVFASGGNLTPGSSPLARQFDREALAAMVTAAHRRGLVVAAHAFGLDSVEDCVAVGVDTIEHCAFATPTGPRIDPALVARMAEDGIIAVPTLGSGPPPADVLAAVPPDIREKVEAIVRHMPAMIAGVQTLLDRGVPITAGTDAGIPNRPFDGLPAAVAFLADRCGIGMTPEEALHTATTTAARTCGLDDRGALRPGLRADLLAVAGDPLTTPTDLARTRLVVKAGEEVAHRAPALAG